MNTKSTEDWAKEFNQKLDGGDVDITILGGILQDMTANWTPAEREDGGQVEDHLNTLGVSRENLAKIQEDNWDDAWAACEFDERIIVCGNHEHIASWHDWDDDADDKAAAWVDAVTGRMEDQGYDVTMSTKFADWNGGRYTNRNYFIGENGVVVPTPIINDAVLEHIAAATDFADAQ